MPKQPSLFYSLLPIIFLVCALFINVRIFGDSSLDGSNQLILLSAAGFAAVLAKLQGIKTNDIWNGIQGTIKDSSKAILILLMVGALTGSWMISGIIPTLIVFGLEILSPSVFLPASVIVCSLVSLATGSSWGTTATIGIALMGVGQSLGFPPTWIAGAVISGAYFGDKMSPISDTTNLAPAMAGAELTKHIRYMSLTSGPAILITLFVFTFMGLGYDNGSLNDISILSSELSNRFNISFWLLLIPIFSIGLIALKTDAVAAMGIGALLGAITAFFVQPNIIAEIGGSDDLVGQYKGIFTSLYGTVSLEMKNPLLNSLMNTRGMSGMLGTIWLIICALTFGGVLEASNFLTRITKAFLAVADTSASLIASTLITCGFINITAADQYLAIVVPGRMFRNAYAEKGLAPENLSRALEDSGTVTSVLIPWNTCGAYQSATLGVATGDYFLYCFFNWLSPIINLSWALLGFRLKKI
ncbi:MAG: Malate-2H(+)/Na(+)-lactate antiporter [Owenweeksia sp. TMED14]|nr:MAG: Malate-2H(+)/Na(+)-lactate antiporter [Owenweeksia sp. TMED14]|tara:strand:+ start:2433 stop:3848 length:1416 start_codon:yes stop_codon:yes gene_type:complete